MEYNFCRRCGDKITSKENDIMLCDRGHHHFGGPIPGAHLYLVDDENNVLMTRRAFDPGKGAIGAIGGFSKPGETAEETVIRETQEESGLTASDYGPLNYLCTATNTYPYQDEERPVLSVAYWAKLKPDHRQIQPADDADDITSLPIIGIDLDQVASSDVRTGLAELKKVLGL